ncbi:MAG: hypothetical protein AB1758_05890 [Candidatus Eremiobacterota bacterium]
MAGHWKTTFLSGALTPDRRKELLRRVDEVLKSVKQAREEANSAQAQEVKAGSASWTGSSNEIELGAD